MKELLQLLRIKYPNRRFEVRVIILYKGAGMDHSLNMKLQFHTAEKKRSRGITMFVSKTWEVGGILFYIWHFN